MDVASLYTNIPQEEGITTVCREHDLFHNYNPSISTNYLRELLGLILKENSFQFSGENYLQMRSTAMGTKMAVVKYKNTDSKYKTTITNYVIYILIT